jgi:hypothetical protein
MRSFPPPSAFAPARSYYYLFFLGEHISSEQFGFYTVELLQRLLEILIATPGGVPKRHIIVCLRGCVCACVANMLPLVAKYNNRMQGEGGWGTERERERESAREWRRREDRTGQDLF